MNGTALIENGSAVDRRPIVTCAGELEVFSQIEDNLIQTLPQDPCDWREVSGTSSEAGAHRSHLYTLQSCGFAEDHPMGSHKTTTVSYLLDGMHGLLLKSSVINKYNITDVDAYKISVREDIENWLKELSAKDIQDWLVVVVENYDGKRANKLLPRTTVLDKIRADFAPKQGDRCISVINPKAKWSLVSADSWRGLVTRIRHLLLVAYARAVSRLEDHVRQQRERRNEVGWDFMQYFQLQEELAQVLEMLGLNDEALVQYDELDALFSQFVTAGEMERSQAGTSELPDNPSLLELRAYLFAKQAHMLLLTNKVWEMASRCVPFLHTCTRELAILEIAAPPGAKACWLFLASMEMLQTCDKFNHAEEVEEYSLHTASLWEYASQKIRELGGTMWFDAGLLPHFGTTPHRPYFFRLAWETIQVHQIVHRLLTNLKRLYVLKMPLTRHTCDTQNSNELAELAVGTYKHIGRLRSARLVGREVASFYMLLGETQKAAAFLGDALRTFEQDGWHELAAQTQIELAECFRKAKDVGKLIGACAFVSAAMEIDTLIRWTYFDEMRKCLDLLDKPLVVSFSTGDIIRMNQIFPGKLFVRDMVISLEMDNKDDHKDGDRYSTGRSLMGKDLKMQDPMLQRLRMKRNLDFKQDRQLATAGIASKFTELRRKNSTVQTNVRGDFSHCLEVGKLPLVITPGLNVIRLNKRASNVGKYYLGQVAIHVRNLHLVSSPLVPRLQLEIKEEGPSLKLYKRAAPLLSGIEQIMNLILTIGSYSIEPLKTCCRYRSQKIKLTASSGLTMQVNPHEPLTNTLEIEVCVTGQCERDLFVEEASLKVGGAIEVIGKNCESSQRLSVFSDESLLFPDEVERRSEIADEPEKLFRLSTSLDADVEPAKGEFCRVGIVCHLHLSMKHVGPQVQANNNVKSVMYEVLAEQSVWAVCGRTAGVVCFDTDEQPQTVVLDVMPLTSGHLPLPLVRISKYIPAEFGGSGKVEVCIMVNPRNGKAFPTQSQYISC
ncbi:hypothetical protein NQ317_014001 [Molorchus minor]|uniref:Trafficking protein particle complex subunit 10 n=1 Tax=Molorchus minor TaxID=1323400 RepID=A0ABQ9J253_9CUCU|nr:hypothetical protein NQ317_014001 [Molorchus minor]